MIRHSMVVHRDDYPGGVPHISFAGQAWLDYVPIRVSDSVCVQEQLPPGAQPF